MTLTADRVFPVRAVREPPTRAPAKSHAHFVSHKGIMLQIGAVTPLHGEHFSGIIQWIYDDE